MSAKVVAKHLADELRKLGLDEMADLAAKGYFGDFTSPLFTPKVTLCEQLLSEANRVRDLSKEQAILVLRKRVMEGEFDG